MGSRQTGYDPLIALGAGRPSVVVARLHKRALIVVGLAVAALLAAGCTSSGSGGPGSPAAVPRVYGQGAYQLRGHGRDFSAEVIVKQINNSVVVLAAGGSYKMRNHLCAPGFSFTFYVNGKKQMTWAAPRSQNCLLNYSSGNHLVCLSSHSSAVKTLKTDVINGCSHPVLPIPTGTDVKLTAATKTTGRKYTVNSVGILLLARSGARSEQ